MPKNLPRRCTQVLQSSLAVLPQPANLGAFIITESDCPRLRISQDPWRSADEPYRLKGSQPLLDGAWTQNSDRFHRNQTAPAPPIELASAIEQRDSLFTTLTVQFSHKSLGDFTKVVHLEFLRTQIRWTTMIDPWCPPLSSSLSW